MSAFAVRDRMHLDQFKRPVHHAPRLLAIADEVIDPLWSPEKSLQTSHVDPQCGCTLLAC
jgi:hypothetical protein